MSISKTRRPASSGRDTDGTLTFEYDTDIFNRWDANAIFLHAVEGRKRIPIRSSFASFFSGLLPDEGARQRWRHLDCRQEMLGLLASHRRRVLARCLSIEAEQRLPPMTMTGSKNSAEKDWLSLSVNCAADRFWAARKAFACHLPVLRTS